MPGEQVIKQECCPPALLGLHQRQPVGTALNTAMTDSPKSQHSSKTEREQILVEKVCTEAGKADR